MGPTASPLIEDFVQIESFNWTAEGVGEPRPALPSTSVFLGRVCFWSGTFHASPNATHGSVDDARRELERYLIWHKSHEKTPFRTTTLWRRWWSQ